MNTRKIILLVFIACSLATFVSGQRKTRKPTILLDKTKAAVFISFLNLKEIKPVEATDESKYLFFRITNNTRWKIWLQMSGVAKKEYGDVRLYFSIEDSEDDTVEIGTTQCHVCSVNPVGSGRSIVFAVPASYVSYDRRLNVDYSFDWERENESILEGSSSTHFVTYHFNQLPKSILSTEKQSGN